MTNQPRVLSVAEEMRVFAGLAVQPFVAAGVAFLIFPWLLLDANGNTLAGHRATDVGRAAGSVAISAGLMAFVVTLVGAWPTAVWLMKRRSVSLSEALLWGLGFGAIPVIAGTLSFGTYGTEGLLRVLAFSSVLGVAGAGMFWTIALRPRPTGVS